MTVEEKLQIPMVQELLAIPENGNLSDKLREDIQRLKEITFLPGETIVKIDASSDDGMYIILSGEAEVCNRDGERVNILNAGETIGEIALLDNSVRTATVKAISSLHCLQMESELFIDLLASNRRMVLAFMKRVYSKTGDLITNQEKLKAELSVASQIQDMMLEHDFSSVNREGNLAFTAQMRPAKMVGGDFYDVFWIDDHRLGFLIADVSGKGVPAAMFMMMAKIHIKNYMMLNMSLDEVAKQANERLCEKNDLNMFVTAFLAVLDLQENRLTYVNAGHNLPYMADETNHFLPLKGCGDCVFGMLEGLNYHKKEIPFYAKNRIYLYTDGVTEATNSNEEMYEEERLQTKLDELLAEKKSCENLVQELYTDVDRFTGTEPQTDDITMVYLERLS